MNRRGFLKFLGLAPVAAVVAKAAPLEAALPDDKFYAIISPQQADDLYGRSPMLDAIEECRNMTATEVQWRTRYALGQIVKYQDQFWECIDPRCCNEVLHQRDGRTGWRYRGS